MQITAFKAILARIINIQGSEDYENTFARMESDCTLRFGFNGIIIVFGCPLTRNINRIKQESRKGLTHCRPRVFLEFDKLCGSRKYPYPPPPTPTEGQWKFRGGGGLKGGNFRGVGGCTYEEFLQRVRKFTKKS